MRSDAEQHGWDQAAAAGHCDHDFECIAAVTGQPLQWYGPERRK